MRNFDGKHVFLTGAASGIGRQLAVQLSARGCQLSLIDVNEDGLQSVQKELRKAGTNVRIYPCDLSEADSVDSMLDRFCTHNSKLDLLINNAGVAYYGPTDLMTQQQWDWLMNINLLSPLRITNRLLPMLLSRPDTHLVNMCSISGLVAGGRFAGYHTSKYGLIGFTESLRAEFGRHGLGVTAICPGPVLTPLYSSAASPKPDRPVPTPPAWMSTTPDRVASVTIRAIERNKRQVLITPVAHALFQLKRFAPGLIDFANQFSRRKKQRQESLRKAADEADRMESARRESCAEATLPLSPDDQPVAGKDSSSSRAA
ncbi:MAG: SDR family oxidoreductase [Planctomycetaceae bacterium]|nr:SDR family oxidoreductase [Planctomycetaceae bacterium]